MTYSLILTEDFRQCAQKMAAKQGRSFKKQLSKALKLLLENPRHPGLKTHKVQSFPGWFEAYINRSDRLIFRQNGEEMHVAWCGNHNDLDCNVFQSSLIKAETRFRNE